MDRRLEIILERLGNIDPEERVAALRDLAATGSPMALEILGETVDDKEPQVRSVALALLASASGDEAMEVVMSFLEDPDHGVRDKAIEILRNLAGSSTGPLVDRLRQSGRLAQRLLAVKVCGEGNDTSSVDFLIQALTDVFSEVRAAAREALARINDPACKRKLVDFVLEEIESSDRVDNLLKFCEIRVPEAIGPITGCLRDRSWRVRLSAAQTLGEIGDQSCLEALATVARDENAAVRYYAKKAIARIRASADHEPTQFQAPPQLSLKPAPRALDAAPKPESIPAVHPAPAVPAPPARPGAIEGKKETASPPPAAPVAPPPAKSDKPPVPKAALKPETPPAEAHAVPVKPVPGVPETSAHTEPPAPEMPHPPAPAAEAAEPMAPAAAEPDPLETHRKALKSPSPEARLGALSDLADPKIATSIFPTIAELVKSDPSEIVRAVAVKRIVSAGTEAAMPIACEALGDPDFRVRANAIETIEALGGPKAISVLSDLLEDRDNRIRTNAAKALHNLGDKGVMKKLLAGLHSDEVWNRDSTAYTLCEIGDGTITRDVVDALTRETERDVKFKLLKCLGKFGDEGAILAVLRLATDDDLELEGEKDRVSSILSRKYPRDFSQAEQLLKLSREREEAERQQKPESSVEEIEFGSDLGLDDSMILDISPGEGDPVPSIDEEIPSLDLNLGDMDEKAAALGETEEIVMEESLDIQAFEEQPEAPDFDLVSDDLELSSELLGETGIDLGAAELDFSPENLDMPSPDLDLEDGALDLGAGDLALDGAEIALEGNGLDLGAVDSLEFASDSLDFGGGDGLTLANGDITLEGNGFDMGGETLEFLPDSLDADVSEVKAPGDELSFDGALTLDNTELDFGDGETDLDLGADFLTPVSDEPDFSAGADALSAQSEEINLDLLSMELDGASAPGLGGVTPPSDEEDLSSMVDGLFAEDLENDVLGSGGGGKSAPPAKPAPGGEEPDLDDLQKLLDESL